MTLRYVAPPFMFGPFREAINAAYRVNEDQALALLLPVARLNETQAEAAHALAFRLVEGVRKARGSAGGVDAFMQEYDLSTEEGIALMCVAEAMLRIPDALTIDKLIRDKLAPRNWQSHLGDSDSLFVNAATWALMLTGKIITDHGQHKRSVKASLKKLLQESSEPLIRAAVGKAMKIIGRQFVMGRNIDDALNNARDAETRGYRYSYDMLGEAARTEEDASRYYEAYRQAIIAIGEAQQGKGHLAAAGISVKLSALHPRYSYTQHARVVKELSPKVLALTQLARQYDIGLTVDAEESQRLDLSLDIIERVFCDPSLSGWSGFGLAIQAYSKRTWFLLDWLIDLARVEKKRWMVRLVKGAYWDSEIKTAQIEGLSGYPVFTRKSNTDVSYTACARKMLAAVDTLYPQFATHNAYSLAAIMALLPESKRASDDFEFQCLHGMGQTLYDQVVGKNALNVPCRVYAPVGNHKDLLPYLVRRLLENGANTSFVNRIVDSRLPIDTIIADPVEHVAQLDHKAHPQIPLPADLYGNLRQNSLGIDYSNRAVVNELAQSLEHWMNKNDWQSAPTRGGGSEPRAVHSPIDKTLVGYARSADSKIMQEALLTAVKAQPAWQAKSCQERAQLLRRAADRLQQQNIPLISLLIREAGKTLFDAMAEIREAIDYCRYYATQAEALPDDAKARGVALCISPWNFPLAIFLGQITSALAAGNAVLAKPADQTTLIAGYAVQLLHEAGLPPEVVQLVPGRGSVVSAALVSDTKVNALMFTGSTETAQTINKTLAKREGINVAFVAETGGQNVMIVDSSALPEQVVDDVILSAFGSAGQRCSALRVLFVQEEIADSVITMLQGSMAELTVGHPGLLNTDIGPVIDEEARQTLSLHAARMEQEAKLIYRVTVNTELTGSFFAPCAFEIRSLSQLSREVFGPILHVIRYKSKDLPEVLRQINASGYGLTMGIHSRIDMTVQEIHRHTRIGNTYVNRNMIGAVVGVQPFGGEGLSGTGPKAGGPHSVPYLCQPRPEWVLGTTENTAVVFSPESSSSSINQALNMAKQSALVWQFVPVAERAQMLEQILEQLILEKSNGLRMLNSTSANPYYEQAIQACRLLAKQAVDTMQNPLILRGPTGEHNQMTLHPRGVVVCLSDNDSFLIGAMVQVFAALLTGNAVVLKPAASRVAMTEWMLEFLRQAGIPNDVVQMVTGGDDTVSRSLVCDQRVDAVMFNGSEKTATELKSLLAEREGKLVPLILASDYSHYLIRLTTERTFSENITAKGGNAALLSLTEDETE